VLSTSLRANGSRERAPDDGLREAIQEPRKQVPVSSIRVGPPGPAVGRPDDGLRPVTNQKDFHHDRTPSPLYG
jgi:hypothetical protein